MRRAESLQLFNPLPENDSPTAPLSSTMKGSNMNKRAEWEQLLWSGGGTPSELPERLRDLLRELDGKLSGESVTAGPSLCRTHTTFIALGSILMNERNKDQFDSGKQGTNKPWERP